METLKHCMKSQIKSRKIKIKKRLHDMDLHEMHIAQHVMLPQTLVKDWIDGVEDIALRYVIMISDFLYLDLEDLLVTKN